MLSNMIYALFLLIPSTLGCFGKSPLTTTTTSPKALALTKDKIIEMIRFDSYYGKGPYFNNCPKYFVSCQSLIMENLEELFSMDTEYFSFAVSNRTKLKLKRWKTWKFEQWPWSPIHLTFYEVNT